MNHEPLRNKHSKLFGNSIYNEQGELNRPVWLRLFLMIKKLDAVNALVHPAVTNNILIYGYNKQNADYILKEAAIMFEVRTNKIFRCCNLCYCT